MCSCYKLDGVPATEAKAIQINVKVKQVWNLINYVGAKNVSPSKNFTATPPFIATPPIINF